MHLDGIKAGLAGPAFVLLVQIQIQLYLPLQISLRAGNTRREILRMF